MNQSEWKYHDESLWLIFPRETEVLFQTNTWWYTVGLWLCIELTFVSFKQSELKTNTPDLFSLFSVTSRRVCAQISGFAEATWMNSSFSCADSIWLWSVSRPEPLMLPDSFYTDVFGRWRWSVETAWVSYKDR